MIEIIEFNCCIFRCGIYKSNNKQIDPHLPKEECDRIVREDLIYSCGKPFQIENKDKTLIVKKCAYI